MTRAISYCLFGDHPMYLAGAVRNAELAQKFYPGWTPIFFCEEQTVPGETIDQIGQAGGQVRIYSSIDFPNGMFARFSIADEPNIERFIIRDVDSRPCEREVHAVEAWIESDLSAHVMRDHPFHAVQMLGGMWGAKGGALNGIEKAARKFGRFKTPYSRKDAYGADQEFLASWVWPRIKGSVLVHDSFHRDRFPGSVDFPDPMKYGDWDFVGQVFNERDEKDPIHWQMRVNKMGR